MSKNAHEFTGRQLGPWTRAVNSGSGNRALVASAIRCLCVFVRMIKPKRLKVQIIKLGTGIGHHDTLSAKRSNSQGQKNSKRRSSGQRELSTGCGLSSSLHYVVARTYWTNKLARQELNSTYYICRPTVKLSNVLQTDLDCDKLNLLLLLLPNVARFLKALSISYNTFCSWLSRVKRAIINWDYSQVSTARVHGASSRVSKMRLSSRAVNSARELG